MLMTYKPVVQDWGLSRQSETKVKKTGTKKPCINVTLGCPLGKGEIKGFAHHSREMTSQFLFLLYKEEKKNSHEKLKTKT